jgi:hypothetical protein
MLKHCKGQMVKVAGIIQKNDKKSDNLTEEDMENIFSKIAEEET